MTNHADPSEWNFAPRGGVDPADRLREQWTRGESPDLKAFLAGHGPHSLGELVDAIRVDQDQRWQNGERPLAELYLRMFSHVDGDSEAAVDVIFQEFLLRQYYGEDHDIERFLGRFPRHEIHLRDQIEFHLALESDGNATPPVHLHRAQDGELPMIPSDVADTRTACAEELPKHFGRYRLMEILGTGGMGTVYLAQDAELGRDVALKIPKLQLGACGAETLARFYREARIAARLTHTNLCPIHDIGQWNGTSYLTMPFIKGETLAARIKRDGPLDIVLAVRTAYQIAQAMEVVHRAGIVHRDLKPANILMAESDKAIVMDYGLARLDRQDDEGLTASGVVLGTPAYLSPERIDAMGKDTSGPAADIYGLGVILYEMLSGVAPFRGSFREVIWQAMSSEPRPLRELCPQLDSALEEICSRAMAKDPRARFMSMDALAGALKAYQPSVDSTGPFSPQPTDARSLVRSADTATQNGTRRLRKRIPGWSVVGLMVATLSVLVVSTRPESNRHAALQTSNDTLQVNTLWLGTFRFRPPMDDYVGDVRLLITHRERDRFQGEYSTENELYAWTIEGAIAADAGVQWHITGVVREREPRPGMLHATASGNLDGDRLTLQLRIPDIDDSNHVDVADLSLLLFTDTR